MLTGSCSPGLEESEVSSHPWESRMMTELQTCDHSDQRGDDPELPAQVLALWVVSSDRRECSRGPPCHTSACGEPLPEEMYQKLVAAKNFRAGSMSLRQLHFASIDLDLHSTFVPGGEESVFDRERKVAQRTTVMQPPPDDRFLCSFSHIFAGGYAAGYFSYKWAEVLSADAFSAFEDVGLDNEPAIVERGQRFRDTVLGLGGGREPLKVFVDFRGRPPSTEALLRHSGLVATA